MNIRHFVLCGDTIAFTNLREVVNMLKSFKMLLVVASLMGLFVISLADHAKAGISCPPPGAGNSVCVDCCKEQCYAPQGQYKNCVEQCSSNHGRDKGQCIANCNLDAACCFDDCLDFECGLGSEQRPAFCALF
jgi:hypothetical protein